MGKGDIKEKDFWALHGLFYNIADALDVDLKDTEYMEEGVSPKAIHKRKSDHRDSIYLLSKALSEELEGVSELSTWQPDDQREPEYSRGRISFFSNGIRDEVVFHTPDENVSYSIYHNGQGEYRWNVLEDLAQGDDIQTALNEHYEIPRKQTNSSPYHQLHRKVLIDDELPESYKGDLQMLLSTERKKNPVGK